MQWNPISKISKAYADWQEAKNRKINKFKDKQRERAKSTQQKPKKRGLRNPGSLKKRHAKQFGRKAVRGPKP